MKQYKIYSDNIEIQALDQFYEALKQPFVVKGALMPDAHMGYTLPIGAVVATKDVIVPAYVGYDIGCGVCAYKTDYTKQDIIHHRENIFNQIYRDLPVGTQRNKKVLNDIPDHQKDFFKKVCDMVGENYDDALKTLGTLGGGNHFCEIGYDEDNHIWIIIHSGSRHLGHTIGTYFMKEAAIQSVDKDRYANEFDDKNDHWKNKNPEGYEKNKKEFIYRRTRARLKTNMEGHYGLDVNSKEGKDYIYCLNTALQYALLNRELMIQTVIGSINKVLNDDHKYDNSYLINRNHNHADYKDGVWIHRKGATHAEKGMMGVIPGNMRDGSFIVEGKGNTGSLCSSSHGAGRTLSRRKAKDTLHIDDFRQEMGNITARVRKDTLDESPMAYKDIFQVMGDQKDLVDIKHHVKPLINIKG